MELVGETVLGQAHLERVLKAKSIDKDAA